MSKNSFKQNDKPIPVEPAKMSEPTEMALPLTPVPAPPPEPEVVTFYSTSSNFNPTIRSPRRILVDGEYKTDNGYTVEFTPISGIKGAGWGSKHVTSDKFEIDALTKLMNQPGMKQYLSMEYRVPPTAQTYYNVDHEQVKLQEMEAGRQVVMRAPLQGR